MTEQQEQQVKDSMTQFIEEKLAEGWSMEMITNYLAEQDLSRSV